MERPFRRDGWGRKVSSRARRSQEALQEVREEFGGPPRGSGWVERHSRRDGRGQEDWERSRVPPRGPGEVRRLSWMAGRGWEAHAEGREWLEALLEGRE